MCAVLQAPAMSWNEGHSWTVTAFLPPGTYPFKLVVAGPGGPECARWENGANRSITISANSPELGTAALVLVDCQFDQTSHTQTETKRVTGIGFRSTSIQGNPHLSVDGKPPSSAPGAAFRTSKVTANATNAADRPVGLSGNGAAAVAVPQQQHQQQLVSKAEAQQLAAPVPANPSNSSSAKQLQATKAAIAAPGSPAFADRMAALDNQLAQILSKRSPSSSPGSSKHSSQHSSPSSSIASSSEEEEAASPAHAETAPSLAAASATAVEPNPPAAAGVTPAVAGAVAAVGTPSTTGSAAAAAAAVPGASTAASGDTVAARRVVSSFIKGELALAHCLYCSFPMGSYKCCSVFCIRLSPVPYSIKLYLITQRLRCC